MRPGGLQDLETPDRSRLYVGQGRGEAPKVGTALKRLSLLPTSSVLSETHQPRTSHRRGAQLPHGEDKAPNRAEGPASRQGRG